jgi:hypothetical protein
MEEEVARIPLEEDHAADEEILDEETAGEGGDRVFFDSVEGNDRMVEGNGLAEVSEALVDFLADVVALPEGAEGRRRLALPPNMLSIHGFR